MEEAKVKTFSCVGIVKKVEVVTQRNGVLTSRSLSGEELEQWKKEHGYDSSDDNIESDTEQ